MGGTAAFIDIISANFGRAPLVPGSWRGVYLTGSGGIEETAAQLEAMKNAHVGAITIDQTPGLGVFAAGNAICADVEPFAGTDFSAREAVAKRQAAGIAEHTLYVSYGNLPALEASIINPAGVGYWVADWSWSANQAMQLLAAHPNWRAIQFGDPQSNPRTLVPGTNVDLAMAQCDIDMGDVAWLSQFLQGSTTPTAPLWPFATSDYLGEPSSDPRCHSGYFSTVDNHVVAVWQQRMRDRGWQVAGGPLVVDGFFGPNSRTVCTEFQQEKRVPATGIVDPRTWVDAWLLPIT